ncbi:hypothetical protein N9241_01650 [bacterium]|nr:hypothetical protein [bacterium]
MSEENKDTLTLTKKKSETENNATARHALRPTLNAAISIRKLGRGGESLDPGFDALINELCKQVAAVTDDDMSRPEALLVAQAHTLDALFGKLLDRSIANMGEYFDAANVYMRLALRAQSQTVQTVRVLNEIKNPKNVAFIKQANVAGGHQQVNNSPAQKLENQPNELLEAEKHERLELGAPKEAVREDSAVETLEEVDGAEKQSRKE